MDADRSPLRRLLAYARPHRARMRRAALWSVLNKVFDLAPPLLIGVAVDLVVEREASVLAHWGFTTVTSQLFALSGLTFLIWAAESVFEYLHKLGWRNLAQDLEHELRMEAYGRVQDMDLAYFEDRSTGGLMAVLNDDVNQLERFLDIGANELLQVSTTVLTIGAVFFWIAPEVAWMSMLPMPFILWGSIVFQKRLAPRYRAVREEVGNLNGDLAGNLGGIATIKSFTAERREVARIGARSDAYRDANTRAIRLSSAFSPLIRMVILCGFTATLAYGGYLAATDRLAVGAYSVMVFLTQRLLWPLTRLGETFDLFQRAMASTTRILDLLDISPGIASGAQDPGEDARTQDLRFEAVRFQYASGSEVLAGVDLDFEAGRTTALVGSTGSGKTTVVKLLLRFYDPTGGSVRLGSQDLRELDLRAYRGLVGLVSQEVFLFHGTVRENIAYGRPDATDEEVREAARIAEADGFIDELPLGYETVVGERGQKLSGGQRQRLSIARAVLKDPPILILDEATSAVDNETEAAIQRSLERVSVGRTTIVIAHRLSTVRGAHRIHVLDRGRVAEVGTHDELVGRADGLYRALWRVQTGEQGPSA
ncbi:MAG: ABC transporter ATP-binding protein [Planctomycetota bacterium]|nr:ABC transporter ATP-binding protein [Planctomycetota bacterium]